ncbi:MAG: RNA polymerase sigma factor [Bacteroidota bacterium]
MDLKKIQAGNEREIRSLTRQVSEWVFGAVLLMLKSRQDAEEVVQDAVLKILTLLIEGDQANAGLKEEGAFKSWAFQIAINKAKDRIKWNNQRKRRIWKESVEVDDTNPAYERAFNLRKSKTEQPLEPEEQLIQNEQLMILWRCIDQLPINQREALVLVKVEGYRMKEAAVIMKTSPKAVESLLSRARVKLKTILAKKQDEA